MEQETKKGKGLLKAAGWIAIVILLSKVVGFLRDVIIANFYGASTVSDAYYYAYQIPALAIVILGGVGGPFHSATVAIFSKIVPNLDTKPAASVKKLFNSFETFSILIFGLISLLCFLYPKFIMGLIIGNASPELLSLASLQLKIMSPVIFCGSVIGIYYGILVTYKHFLLPNISPSFLSLGIVITLLITGGDKTGVYLAYGTLLGALLQIFAQTPVVWKIGYTFRPCFEFFKDKNFKEIMELLLPAFLSSTIGQLGLYVDMFFASGLKEGAWTSLGYANRIFQFPVGLLLAAVLVPLFPLFSRLVGQKDYVGVSHYFQKGISSLFFISSYLMVLIFIIRYDAIKFVLERGAFNESATLMVADILFIITVSILPYVFRDSATRLLYAFNDSKIPFLTATCAIILKIFLNMLLVRHMGVYGIATSTACITLFNAILLGYFASRRIKIGYVSIFKTLSKILFVAFLTYIIGKISHIILTNLFDWTFIFGFIKICTITVITAISFVLFSHLFKVDCLEDLILKIKERVKSNAL